MLNLHPPFRWAKPQDVDGLARSGFAAEPSARQAVVAEEAGQLAGFLAGAVEGEAWTVQALHLSADRAADLGPRFLAVADAIAADEGLAFVRLNAAGLADGLAALLGQEGFRPEGAPGQGASAWMRRPVIPQG